jgi:hypothetical protein
MAIITRAEVKGFLQIKDSSKDDLIDALIPEIQGDIVAYCNNSFMDSNGADAWPVGIKIPAAMMVGYTMTEMAGGTSVGLKSESQGDYSYTKDTTTGAYPDSILKKLDKWRIVRAHFGSKMQQNYDRRGMTPKQLAEDQVVNGIDGELLNED